MRPPSPAVLQGYRGEPIAIEVLEGPIFSSDDLVRRLNAFGEEKSLKALVLRIDSPGGAVGPSQEIHREVLRLKEKGKKVVISMGTMAASGGYYVAVAGDKIYANPGTITGSIGVIIQSFGLQEAAKSLKLERRVFKSGKFKDILEPFRPVTEDEKVFIQSFIDNSYERFLVDVSQGRSIPLEKIRELAEGKIYTGEQAKQAGLVDELGNIFDAIAAARELAKLDKNADVMWPTEPSAFEQFFSPQGALGALQNLGLFLRADPLPLWMSSMSGENLTE